MTIHQKRRRIEGGLEKGKVAWGRGDGSGLEWKGIDSTVMREVEGRWLEEEEEEEGVVGAGLGPLGVWTLAHYRRVSKF